MGYKDVVFDLDGTILDTQIGIAKAFQMALKSYDIDESIEEIQKLIGPPLSRTIITKYGFSEEDGKKAMDVHRSYFRETGMFEGGFFEGVNEMLESLKNKGIKMAIATNKPEEFAISQLEHFKLDHYFEAIIGNNLDQTRGTKADFIKMAMEDSGFNDKNNVCMVGDRHHDIDGGKEVGIDTIGVLYGYGSLEEMKKCAPTYIVKDAKELEEILTKDL